MREEKKKEREKRERREREEEVKEGWGGAGAQLTARDVAALEWLAVSRAATVAQLTVLLGHLGGAPITARRGAQVIARWEALGMVEKMNLFHQEPACVTLTTNGAKLTGRSRWRRPALGTMRHTLAVAQVRLQIERPGSGVRWITENQLRAVLPLGARLPDGAIWHDAELTAVEVELSAKGRTRTTENVVSVLSCLEGTQPRFAKVLYLVNERTKVLVEGVRADLPEHYRDRMVVLPCPA